MSPIPTVFVPALLCDERLNTDVIAALGDQIKAQVLSSPQPTFAASIMDILARAPETFVLVGTSYGGNLALELALSSPERVRALWLIGCDHTAAQAGGPDLAAGLDAAPDAVTEMLSGLVVRQEDTVAAGKFRDMAHKVGGAAEAAQARANGARADLAGRLGKPTMPALIMFGEEDAVVSVATGRDLAAALPNAQFQQIDACGHLPTLEQPAQAAQLFSTFLNNSL